MRLGRKRSLLALALIGLLTVGLGACGDDDDSESADTTEAAAEPSGPNVVTIKEVDYGYTVSGTAREGWLTLDVENTGKEFHMVALGKLKSGKTTADILKTFQEQGGGGEQTTTSAGEQEQDPFADIFESDDFGAPGGLTQPGGHYKVTTNKLTPGKYALMCFIPTEGEGIPHAAKGMLAGLEVKDVATPAPEPTETAQAFTIHKDKPGTGPTTLPAGDVTFKVTADSGEHEFSVAQTKPGKTLVDADKYFSSVFDSDEPPAKGTVANAPTTLVDNVFEFGSGDTIYVTIVGLKPGTYYVGCTYSENSDDDDPTNNVFHGAKEAIKVTVT